MVEYAMLIIAMVVGTAAAKKTLGARVATLASQASVVFGGAAFASGAGGAGDGAGDERSGVTKLPDVGTGPDATPEEMAAADKNHDGVLSTEEMGELRRQKDAQEKNGEQDKNAKMLGPEQKQAQQTEQTNNAAIEKKGQENVKGAVGKGGR